MFRDAKEELERLEQLLQEEETEGEAMPEEAETDPEEAQDDFDLDEEEESPPLYRNYSNDYGKKIYNSDRADIDPDDLSEALMQPKKRGVSCLVALVFILLTGILIMLGLFALKMRGVL